MKLFHKKTNEETMISSHCVVFDSKKICLFRKNKQNSYEVVRD